MTPGLLFSAPEVLPVLHVYNFLEAHHYLGGADRGFAWSDEFGVMVLANPTAKFLPQERWLELTRWCLLGARNGGSRQFSRLRAWLLLALPEVTTLVSYSDSSQGHTGALYRACNWLWAPTWHRLRPPPSGNGDRGTGRQAVKDRWVFPLRPDPERAAILAVQDMALLNRMPWASYAEPRFRGLHFSGGGADYRRFLAVSG